MSIPNLLSTVRLCLVPVFAYTYLTASDPKGFMLAAGVLVVSGLTDLLDGWIARHFNMITYLGQILDPAADKITSVTVCICIAIRCPTFILAAIIFFVKEFLMFAGSVYLLRHGQAIQAARWYGKLATLVFYTLTFFIVLNPNMKPAILTTLMLTVSAFILFAFIMYVPEFRKQFREVRERKAR